MERFDVFLCYNGDDRLAVKHIAELLQNKGLHPWLDEKELRPGMPWQQVLQQRIDSISAAAVFVGEDGIGPWQREEIDALLMQFARRGAPVIPVLLWNAPAEPELPVFLSTRTWVDFRHQDPDPVGQLVWGITGDKEAGEATPDSRRFAWSIRAHMGTLSRTLTSLTQDQFEVISRLRGCRRVRICGCAGSGKTLVAAEKAIRLSRAGLSTLFLCHNPLLANHISDLTLGAGVTVAPFGEWAATLAGEPSAYDPAGRWTKFAEPTSDSLAKAIEALREHSAAYDAIIVDEGQDFRPAWWEVVESALMSPRSGILYIFHDDNQALLPYRASYPAHDTTLDLSRNCRNAGRVYDLMRRLHPAVPEPSEKLQQMGATRLVSYSRGDEVETIRSAVRHIIDAHQANDFRSWLQGDDDDAPREGGAGRLIFLRSGSGRFEKSPFHNLKLVLSSNDGWQKEVVHRFGRCSTSYDTRGVKLPTGGKNEVLAKLRALSDSPQPSRKDVALVRQLARSFGVTSSVRRQTKSRHPFKWTVHGGRVKLRRPGRTRIWAADVISFFERDDWDHGVPETDSVAFADALGPCPRDAVPVYHVSDFKGLEADVVVFFASGPAPISKTELYVGISRARMQLVLLINQQIVGQLPYSIRDLVAEN